MLTYPITLKNDDGTLLATSPDFPELTTFGEDREEAIARAVHALEEAMPPESTTAGTSPGRHGERTTPLCRP